MAFLNWCLGLMLLLTWRDVLVHVFGRVNWEWWLFFVLWFCLWFVLAITGLVRWTIGKMKAGALAVPTKGMTNAPASKVEERT